jgi:hypothetical protein
MRPADRLAEFTRAALAAGHSRAEAAAALRAAGWADSEIAAALDAWADTSFRPPVPRPGRSVSAAEAFTYGLTFVALALVAGHVTALWFALIGRALPLPGEMPWYSTGTIRWSLAVLAVSFPLFLWLDLRAARAGAADPAQRRSAVRGWFAHAALFLAVLGLAGDLVAVLYAFLSGELTLRFAAKATVVAALAGTVFLYFRPLRAAASAPPLRPAVWMLAGLVLPAMALGLLAVGGPARGQAEARDRIRMEDIATLVTHVECRANEAGGLPAALDGTDSCPLPARTADPFTGAAYGYARVSDVAFRLCAAFETDQTDRLPWQASGFDPATGCLTLRHDRPDARP